MQWNARSQIALLVIATVAGAAALERFESPSVASGEQTVDEPQSDRRSENGWELYFWPAETSAGEWEFALLPGTHRMKRDDEIRRDPLHGMQALRDSMATLAEDEWVALHWRNVDREAFELTERIKQIAIDNGLRIVRLRSVMSFRSGDDRPIAVDDPIRRVLDQHQEQIAARYAEKRQILPHFNEWQEIGGGAAAELFPQLRFAAISHDQHQHPDATERAWGRAMGIRSIVAVDSKTNKKVLALHGSHVDIKAFGDLLADQQITLASAEDAEAIWAAYSDLSVGDRGPTEPSQVREGLWLLNVRSFDQGVAVIDGMRIVVTRTIYTEIRTDPESDRVRSARTRIETSDRREVPVEAVEPSTPKLQPVIDGQ